MTLLVDLLLVSLALIVHEAGHYFAFWYYGARSPVTLYWWGISMGEFETFALTPIQFTVVGLAGVLIGYVPILFVGDSMWHIAYWLACGIDLFSIFYMIALGYFAKGKRTQRIFDLECEKIVQAQMYLEKRGLL